MSPFVASRRMAIVLVGLFAVVPGAMADLIYEPFAYTAGASLDGLAATGQNLAGNYATSSLFDLVVAAPGLTHGSLLGGLPGVAGNRLSYASLSTAGIVTVAVDQDVVIAPGQQIFFSALFTFDDTNNGVQRASVHFVDDATGNELSFGESVAGVRAIRVTAKTAATGGITVGAGADNAFVNGQTLWLIGHYLNGAASGSDAIELIGYDTAQAVAVAPSFDLSDPNAQFSYSLSGVDIDFSTISSIRFEVRGANNNFVDELRVSEVYPAAPPVAVPEPAGLEMLLCGIGLVLAWGRSRRGQHDA